MPQLLLAAEELSCSLFPPQPQASLALAGARSQGGMILTLETSPATPPPHSSRSGPHFLPPQHFLCLQLRQLAGCKSEPRPVWPGFAQPAQPRETLFWRGGEELPRQQRKPPRVCSLLALAAHSVTLSYTGTAAVWRIFPCSRTSPLRALPAQTLACDARGRMRLSCRRCLGGHPPSLLLVCSEMNGSALQC